MCVPPPAGVSPAHGDVPSPSAGRERSVQLQMMEVELEAGWVGPVGSE